MRFGILRDLAPLFVNLDVAGLQRLLFGQLTFLDALVARFRQLPRIANGSIHQLLGELLSTTYTHPPSTSTVRKTSQKLFCEYRLLVVNLPDDALDLLEIGPEPPAARQVQRPGCAHLWGFIPEVVRVSLLERSLILKVVYARCGYRIVGRVAFRAVWPLI